MLNETKHMQNFYYQQNIQLRRQIRQLDMQFRQITNNKSLNKHSIKQQQLAKQQINFFVIGPAKSGKTSLLKTIFFALNSHNNVEVSLSELPMTIIKRFDIKKSKRYNVEGLTKMKQTDQKRTITGYEFQTKVSSYYNKQLSNQQKTTKIFQKYTYALQILDNKIIGCFNISIPQPSSLFSIKPESSHNFNIKTVIICLNILTSIQYQQISCIKFFLSDIKQKGIKTLIVLTHIDKLNKIKQNDKLMLIEERIQILKKQLDIKDRDDFICIQNYREIVSTKINNNTNKFKQYNHNIVNDNKKSSFANIHIPKNNISQANYNYLYSKSINQVKYGSYKKISSNNQQYLHTQTQFSIDVPIISNKHLKIQNNEKINSYQQISLSHHNNHFNSNQISFTTSQVSKQPLISPLNQYRQLQHFQSKPYIQESKSIKKQKNQLQIQSFYSQRDLQKIKSNHPIYHENNFNNKEEINYYALKLLIRIIKENEKYNKQMKNKKLKWFCG